MGDSISVTIEERKVEVTVLTPNFIQVNLLEPVILESVSENTTHRLGDGSDHSDVALNTTHRGRTDNPHNTPVATEQSIGDLIAGADEKSSLVGPDKFAVSNSANGDVLVWFSWSSMLTRLLVYFLGIFQPKNTETDLGTVSGGTLSINFLNGTTQAYEADGDHTWTFGDDSAVYGSVGVEIVVTALTTIIYPADAALFSTQTLSALAPGTYKAIVFRLIKDPVYNYGIAVGVKQ